MDGNTVKKKLSEKFGVSSRCFTASQDIYSMGSTWVVGIHTATISKDEVEKFCKEELELEYIRRCKSTGDILGGGNTFLRVDYTENARNDAELNAYFCENIFNYIIESDIEAEVILHSLNDRHSMRTLLDHHFNDIKAIGVEMGVLSENTSLSNYQELFFSISSHEHLVNKLKLRLHSEQL